MEVCEKNETKPHKAGRGGAGGIMSRGVSREYIQVA